MKRKTKVMVNAAVSMALCASLIAGSTFALFTSRSDVNIAITSGKVHVTATANISDAWSAKYVGTGYEEDHNLATVDGGFNFTNGGMATYDETNNILTIDKITPGDGIKVNIKTENYSTIKIKYETVVTLISEDATLFEGLKLEVDGTTINKKLKTAVSDWETPTYNGGAEDGKIDDITLSIELPIEADNTYMTDAEGEPLSCQLAIGIYAVQANGHDGTYQNVVLIKNSEQFKDQLQTAEPGEVLSMDSGEYELDKAVPLPSGVSLKGEQAGVPASEWIDDKEAKRTVIKVSDDYDLNASDHKLLEILQDAGEETKDVVLDGIEVDCCEQNVKGIYVKKSGGSAMTGIEIKNCAVIDCVNDGIDVSNTDGAVIEGNYVESITDNGIRLGNYKNTDGKTAYVRNNVIDTINGTINGAIAVTEGSGDVVVSGNTIKNVKSGHEYPSTIGVGESAITIEKLFEGGVITVEDNTLENVEQGIGVYKFSAIDENSKVIIRNNTIKNFDVYAIAVSSLHYDLKENNTCSCVEIINNTITCEPEKEEGSKGPIYVERTNRYDETMTTPWQVTASGNTYNGGTSYQGKDFNTTYKHDGE